MSNDDRKPTTTDAGIPVSSDEHSLTVGPDGPILLQDHYLVEQMTNFNRERIPEHGVRRRPQSQGIAYNQVFYLSYKECFEPSLRKPFHRENTCSLLRDLSFSIVIYSDKTSFWSLPEGGHMILPGRWRGSVPFPGNP